MDFVWSDQVFGLGLMILTTKLKKAKIALNSWNKTIFGQIDQNMKELEN